MHAPDDLYQYQEVLVSPMYLAGSNGTGEAGFAPVAQWPHQYLDEGPCQLLVTSPDQRIRIGWFGDDFELWKISAAEDAFSAPRWTATFNHVTPAEMVAGLTTALVQDYDEAIASDTLGRFLTGPTVPWRDTVRPLTDAGWAWTEVLDSAPSRSSLLTTKLASLSTGGATAPTARPSSCGRARQAGALVPKRPSRPALRPI